VVARGSLLVQVTHTESGPAKVCGGLDDRAPNARESGRKAPRGWVRGGSFPLLPGEGSGEGATIFHFFHNLVSKRRILVDI